MDEDRPPSEEWQAAARALLGEARFTSTEAAELGGWSAGDMKRLWRAIGLPPMPADERTSSDADVAIARSLGALLAQRGTDIEVAVQIARVIGRATARIADAVVAAAAEARQTSDDAGAPDVSLPESVAALAPALEPFMIHVWRHHLVAALLRATSGGVAAATDPVQAVGFADLVGFTASSQQLDTRALTALVDRFEAVAYERVVEGGGRIVKMIGDEVMFAAADARVCATIALALVGACASDPRLPAVRIGIAVGPTRSWEGDLFGPTVNLASRLVAIARPGSVLASDELGGALDPGAFELRHLRPVHLKGIGRVRSWVVRPG